MSTLGPAFHRPLAAPLPPPPTVTGKVAAVTGKLADSPVTIRYRDHIRWNTSKIISRPNSLRPMRSLTPNMGDLVQREHPKN